MSRTALTLLLAALLTGTLARPATPPRPADSSLAGASGWSGPLAGASGGYGPRAGSSGDWANTYSIVAYDPKHKEWGVAVASKYLAVGSAVPHARAGAGAVATQSFVNVTLGTRGLRLLGKGKSAEEALKELTESDKGRAWRQLGVVDAKGRVANFTGKKCLAWAGAKSGKHYSCQGNLLKGEEVVAAMAKAYEGHAKWPLAWRLQAALEAGEKAGGDRRGKQSAAVLVVREHAGPNGLGDRAIDLRVDDHDNPVQELARILAKALRRPKKPE
jgi:uncharacterized Ntn-hydrolase superfamily protein